MLQLHAFAHPYDTDKGLKSLREVNEVERPFIYARPLVFAREEQCILCEKRGHSDDKCFWNPENPDNRLHIQLVKCRCCRRRGHLTEDCFFNENGDNFRPDSARAMKVKKPPLFGFRAGARF